MKKLIRTTAVALAVLAISAGMAHANPFVAQTTEELPYTAMNTLGDRVFHLSTIIGYDIQQVQQAWGDALVSISRAYRTGGDFLAPAVAALDNLYGFEYGPVMFKPTLTTFRHDWAGAASYFIGHHAGADKPLLEGDGFALLDHEQVVFDDGTVIINGNQAIWQGYVTITSSTGEITVVHKTFGYFRGHDGTLRINLHHSSLPVAH